MSTESHRVPPGGPVDRTAEGLVDGLVSGLNQLLSRASFDGQWVGKEDGEVSWASLTEMMETATAVFGG